MIERLSLSLCGRWPAADRHSKIEGRFFYQETGSCFREVGSSAAWGKSLREGEKGGNCASH